jgi:hypothetical protein
MSHLIQPSPALLMILFTKAMVRDRLHDKEAYKYTRAAHCKYVDDKGMDNTMYEAVYGKKFDAN